MQALDSISMTCDHSGACTYADAPPPPAPAAKVSDKPATNCTLVDIGGVAGGCPKAAKGGAAPTSCPPAFTVVVSPWFTTCAGSDAFAQANATLSGPARGA
jgi:hypothetical protein